MKSAISYRRKGTDVMKHNQVKAFLVREPVLTIALFLAGISLFLVPPNPNYMHYIDGKTLGCLFSLMLVVAGFRKLYLFTFLSQYLLHFAKSSRQVSALLVSITFILSMLVTNDVALITFVPLTIVVFSLCKDTKPIMLTIIFQTIAANVGSGLTPVGNPQNLFIYSFYEWSLLQFFGTMAPYVLGGLLLLFVCLLFIPNTKETFELQTQEVPPLNKKRLARYLLLFFLSLAAVFDLVPYLLVVLIVIIFSEKILLKDVDYSLLLTFIGFFIFVGNLGQIPFVVHTLQTLLNGREFIVSLAASQIISNVPATLLLAQFTSNAEELLRGVNAGGCGTLIASMASVISFKIYAHYDSTRTVRYLAVFTIFNLLFVLLFLLIHFVLK